MTSTTLAEVSNDLLYGAMVVYALAMLGFAGELSLWRPVRDRVEQEDLVGVWTSGSLATAEPPKPSQPLADTSGMARAARADRFGRVGVSLTVLAFLLHLASVVARGWSAERAPWGNMFEFSVTGALAVTGVFLVLLSRRDIRYLGTFVVLPVLLTLGLAVTVLYTESAQLVPALKSVWLVIHVSIATIATGLLTVSFAASVLQLLKDSRDAGSPHLAHPRLRLLDALPSVRELEALSFRVTAVGFVLWTFTVMAGAIWAEQVWGRYWGWDPKEVWSFVVWVVYAAYLHARTTRGWSGRRAAWFVVVGYATVIFNFTGVNLLFQGLHAYSGLPGEGRDAG